MPNEGALGSILQKITDMAARKKPPQKKKPQKTVKKKTTKKGTKKKTTTRKKPVKKTATKKKPAKKTIKKKTTRKKTTKKAPKKTTKKKTITRKKPTKKTTRKKATKKRTTKKTLKKKTTKRTTSTKKRTVKKAKKTAKKKNTRRKPAKKTIKKKTTKKKPAKKTVKKKTTKKTTSKKKPKKTTKKTAKKTTIKKPEKKPTKTKKPEKKPKYAPFNIPIEKPTPATYPKTRSVKNLKPLTITDPRTTPWDPTRSKIKAAIENGLPESYLHVQRLLYIGTGHGYTISHIHTKPLELYAIEKSGEMMRHFLPLAEDLPTVLPIYGDAANPDGYAQLIPKKVDVVFQDIAQKDQTGIFLANCERFLAPHGVGILTLKSASVDSNAEPAAVFAETRQRLETGGATIVQEISLEPYQKHHRLYVVHLNPYWDW